MLLLYLFFQLYKNAVLQLIFLNQILYEEEFNTDFSKAMYVFNAYIFFWRLLFLFFNYSLYSILVSDVQQNG